MRVLGDSAESTKLFEFMEHSTYRIISIDFFPLPTIAGCIGSLKKSLAFLLAFACSTVVTGQETIWVEDFENFTVGYGWDGDSNSAADEVKWTIDYPNNCDYFSVVNDGGEKALEGNDIDGTASWTSETVSMTGWASPSLGVTMSEDGCGGSDGYEIFARYDGGSLVSLTSNSGGFDSDVLDIDLVVCTTVQIVIEIENNKNQEFIRIEGVELSGACPNNWYADNDGDGYGDLNNSDCSGSQPDGYVANFSDCDDSDSSIFGTVYYADVDGDGLGDENSPQVTCGSQPAGHVSNSSDISDSHYGTVLSPGDVFFAYGNKEDKDATGYVTCVTMVDLLPGTQLVLTPKLEWNGTGWEGDGKGTILWTVPSGGVAKGAELVFTDLNNDQDTGGVLVSAIDNPITINPDNETEFTGGIACGTYEHLDDDREGFIKEHMWIFQPGTDGIDHNPRHLTCIGGDIDKDSNTGVGTLLYSSAGIGNLDGDFCFQSDLFKHTNWRYYGENTLNSIVLDAEIQSLSSKKLNEVASGYFSDLSNYESVNGGNYEDEVNFAPIGTFCADEDYTWSGLETANTTWDILLEDEFDLVVDVAEGVEANNITIEKGNFTCDGGSRMVTATGNIQMGGDGTSTFELGGVLTMASDQDQVIDANNYTDSGNQRVKTKRLKIKNSKNAKVKGHVTLLPGGALEFDENSEGDKIEIDSEVSSSLIFRSSDSGTAAIGTCGASNFGAGVDQEFTFERFIPEDENNSWVNIGAYVTGTTVADWTAAISGMLIFEYEETNYGSLSAGWSYLWDSTVELMPGKGYMALIPAGESGTISVTGKFEMGDVSIPLTFTDDANQSNTAVDGWNLVSNPYPASVDLIAVLASNDLVEEYFIFDNTGDGSYSVRNDGGTGDAPEVLAVGQSFWVKVEAATSITFSEEDKVLDGVSTFMREYDEDDGGSVGLTASNASQEWARAFIGFHAQATPEFDDSYDALHFNAENLTDLRMWTESSAGDHLAIQTVGAIENTPSMPLHVMTGSGGEVTFKNFEENDMPADVCVVLEDTETGDQAQMGYDSLVVDLPASTYFADRFVLHFNSMPTAEVTSTTCNGLDVQMLDGDFAGWSLGWASEDGELSGTDMPNELPDGSYVFTYSLNDAGCQQAISVVVESVCLGDFNFNGERDITDLLFLLSGLPGGQTTGDYLEAADCDCDGAVTVNDMLTFLTVFSTNCSE